MVWKTTHYNFSTWINHLLCRTYSYKKQCRLQMGIFSRRQQGNVIVFNPRPFFGIKLMVEVLHDCNIKPKNYTMSAASNRLAKTWSFDSKIRVKHELLTLHIHITHESIRNDMLYSICGDTWSSLYDVKKKDFHILL